MAALRVAAAVKVGAAFGTNSALQTDGSPRVSMPKLAPASCPRVSAAGIKTRSLFGVAVGKKSKGLAQSRSGVSVRASAGPGSEKEEEKKSVAPLVPSSGTGQFLVMLLEKYPHLLPAAADSQLERLAEERDAASSQEASTSGTELVLYKRIAEVKAAERRQAVEETMYALVVQKFLECGLPMVPKLPSQVGQEPMLVDLGPGMEKELESMHSAEALEMVKEHMTIMIGGTGSSSWADQHILAQISKLRVGQVYAASIMFGYFLRWVDRRYQLEKRMKALTEGAVDQTTHSEQTVDYQPSAEGEQLAAEAAAAVASMVAARNSKIDASRLLKAIGKPCKLRSYAMSFDVETLQKAATMRTGESLNLIEKQTEALFGKPDVKVGPDGNLVIGKDDTVRINFSGLRRLLMEAVAFGSFLWDVENYVDVHYPLAAQQG